MLVKIEQHEIHYTLIIHRRLWPVAFRAGVSKRYAVYPCGGYFFIDAGIAGRNAVTKRLL